MGSMWALCGFVRRKIRKRLEEILWDSMNENLVKKSFLEMCSMCNTREGKIAWNCIV
jgi:hypothetical protein